MEITSTDIGLVSRVAHLSKSYGSADNTVSALTDVTIGIRRGEFTAIMGPSGSGKSTLMHIMAGLDSATSGQVWLGDTDITSLGDSQLTVLRRRRVGFVFQSFNLVPTLDIAGNLLLPFELDGRRPTSDERAWIDSLIASLGLGDRLSHRPHELSGGQQQRVGVARGLAADPNILLMDEPFGAVDPIVRAELQHELIRLQRELDKTVVFVTHDIDEAFLLGDQVVILEKGAKIAQQGHPREILANPANEFVASFIGADRGKRRLTAETQPGKSGDVLLVDGTGYAAGVISAPGGKLAYSSAAYSISDKTDQAGDA